jgi:hypothetical protein
MEKTGSGYCKIPATPKLLTSLAQAAMVKTMAQPHKK